METHNTRLHTGAGFCAVRREMSDLRFGAFEELPVVSPMEQGYGAQGLDEVRIVSERGSPLFAFSD